MPVPSSLQSLSAAAETRRGERLSPHWPLPGTAAIHLAVDAFLALDPRRCPYGSLGIEIDVLQDKRRPGDSPNGQRESPASSSSPACSSSCTAMMRRPWAQVRRERS